MRWPLVAGVVLLAACGRTDLFGPVSFASDAGPRPDAGTAVCGNGLLEDAEACDDGNRADDDSCRRTCVKARCGDGVVWKDVERCDDGNQVDTDGCTRRCAPADCGDGVVQPGEACDDGNAADDDACLSSCLSARCGDGHVRALVEQCDDGNELDSDACLTTCATARCGDGVTWLGVEGCDDANRVDGDACLNTCVPARCGDGVLWTGRETCDDGNGLNTDECVGACVPARCGDGFVRQGLEGCDDANQVETDACRNVCIPARCGDGVVWAGVEQCDDANRAETDACRSSCQAARCGDGVVWAGQETCDDGNTVDTDACRATCVPARCGDGVAQVGVDQCDDGNQADDDGCGNDCRLPVCGDGEREGVEQCDLGAQNGNRPAFLISQPSGTRIATNPLVRGRSATVFYDYRSASSHTGFEVVQESRIYLYVDSNTGRLSLILTHGVDDDAGQVQPTSTVQMGVSGLPTVVSIDLTDDTPGEFFRTSPTTAAGRWNFVRNSDGAVLGGFPFPGSWRVVVTPGFLTGITTWGWVRHDLQRIPLVMTEPITIESFPDTSLCRATCTVPRCGDGVLDGGEVCDDGNTVGGDGCSADCRALR